MKYLTASLGLGVVLLAGCMSSPSEFYGIRQAVPEQEFTKSATVSSQQQSAPIADTSTGTSHNASSEGISH